MLRYLTIALATTSAHAEVDFARDIRPILNANCTACHGGVKEAGEVSFIYRDKALGKGESGKPVIVPGNPEASEMFVRITSTDPDEVMPKPEHGATLPPDQIKLVREWIEQGAEWGEHWSFVQPAKVKAPDVKQGDWPRNDIDHYILARLESEGLKPSPEADRAAQLRRVSLDLIGLPPTLEEIDAFIADKSADAYEKQIDRLLASPRFGERWASVWMDLARYADSRGLGDDRRRVVWKYRDWLIDAFNRDLPFDQFTIDQLAGDLVPDAALEQKIASAFHRMSQQNDEGGTDDEEFRVAAVIDRVSTTWEAWQGITMGCVQCHSHPYDPIEHDEFYEFSAFFNQTADADITEDFPILSVPLDRNHYALANEAYERIEDAELQLHLNRKTIDEQTNWKPAPLKSAHSKKAKLTITQTDGVPEYRADPNAAAGAIYELDFPAPAGLEQLTALRLEFLPLDLEKAAHSAEWGAILKMIELHTIDPTGKTTKIPLAEIFADEAHPFFDPNASLTAKGGGWGTYSKTFGPRHCTIVLEQALEITPDTRLRATLHNGPMILASFPMVSKRGRLFLTDQPDWIRHRSTVETAALQTSIRNAKTKLKSIPSTTLPVMRERAPEFARETRVFERGNWLMKTDLVEPNTPGLFPPLPNSDAPARLRMAQWMASPENPLTSRVAVNRFWLELFGTGIVATPEDFGSAGEKPSHPELLDSLAVDFSGSMKWSMKALLRKIATSATYRQSSVLRPGLEERDPSNRLLARGPRQRLTAEMARDHALAVSGLISTKFGGPPAHPPMAQGAWKPFARDSWDTPEEGDAERYRRSVYTYWKRSSIYPTFATFDAPSRETCSKRRLVSNTPLQALAVLNDPAFHECAKGLARQMKYDSEGSIEDRLFIGYRIATSRKPDAERIDELAALYKSLEARYSAQPDLMKEVAGTPDGAAYTVVASVLLNLDEALTR